MVFSTVTLCTAIGFSSFSEFHAEMRKPDTQIEVQQIFSSLNWHLQRKRTECGFRKLRSGDVPVLLPPSMTSPPFFIKIFAWVIFRITAFPRLVKKKAPIDKPVSER